MQITTSSPNPAVTVLQLDGRLDSEGSPAFDRVVTPLLLANQPKVVVDCSALSHVASFGLRSLLTAAKRCDQAGGRMVFCAAPEPVAQIFSLAGFDSLFSAHATVDEAVAALS